MLRYSILIVYSLTSFSLSDCILSTVTILRHVVKFLLYCGAETAGLMENALQDSCTVSPAISSVIFQSFPYA